MSEPFPNQINVEFRKKRQTSKIPYLKTDLVLQGRSVAQNSIMFLSPLLQYLRKFITANDAVTSIRYNKVYLLHKQSDCFGNNQFYIHVYPAFRKGKLEMREHEKLNTYKYIMCNREKGWCGLVRWNKVS